MRVRGENRQRNVWMMGNHIHEKWCKLEVANRAVSVLLGRAAWYNKTWTVLIWPDNMIISLDHDLLAIISKLTYETFSIIQ